MTREEYNELKARAHDLMLEDYEWMLQQEPERYQWGHPLCWLIEFVHDVSNIATQKNVDEEDLCDAWHDNQFRKKPLCQLYEGFFAQVGVAVPQHHAVLYERDSKESQLPHHRTSDGNEGRMKPNWCWHR